MVRPSIDLFREACGATGPLQLCVEGPKGETLRRSLEPPFALVGRNTFADLPLEDHQVSRRHAYFQIIEGRVFCVDLQSRTGVHWEGGPNQSGWLDRGQGVGVGPYRLRLLGGDHGHPIPGDDGLNPLLAQPNAHLSLPGVTLEVLQGGSQRVIGRMNCVLALLGKSPECQARLSSSTVSRFHCSLVRTPAGVWVIDLLGQGGVRVNGTRVRWACLQDGDRLQVGKFQILLHSDHPAYPAPHFPRVTRAVAPRGPHRAPVATNNESGYPVPVPLGDETLLLPQERWAGGSGETDSVLLPLFGQLAQMHQDLFDQFQQGLQLMAQMFCSLHREQVGLVREELARLHQLTEELHSLRAELGRTPAAPNPPAISSPAVDPEAPAPGMQPLRPEPPASSDGSRAAALAGKPTGQGQTGDAAVAPEGRAAADSPPAPAEQPDEGIHTWLNRRIAAVQQERQSRWQKIVHFIMSGRSGESVP